MHEQVPNLIAGSYAVPLTGCSGAIHPVWYYGVNTPCCGRDSCRPAWIEVGGQNGVPGAGGWYTGVTVTLSNDIVNQGGQYICRLKLAATAYFYDSRQSLNCGCSAEGIIRTKPAVRAPQGYWYCEPWNCSGLSGVLPVTTTSSCTDTWPPKPGRFSFAGMSINVLFA